MSHSHGTLDEQDLPVDTQYDDFFSLDLLISRVEQIQRREQLERIRILTRDNALLQQLAANYQRQWIRTLLLLEKTQTAIVSLREALEHCYSENVAAEQAWLALWGIRTEATGSGAYSLAGWI